MNDSKKNEYTCLLKQVIWTLALVGIFEIISNIPVPFVNPWAYASTIPNMLNRFNTYSVLNLLSGDNLRHISIFSIGIIPCFIVMIISLLPPVIARLKKGSLQKQSERYSISHNIQLLAIVALAVFLSYWLVHTLEQMIHYDYGRYFTVAQFSGWYNRLIAVMTLTAGSMLAIWLVNRITKLGIANGVLLIVYSGIFNLGSLFELVQYARAGVLSFGYFFRSAFMAQWTLSILLMVTAVMWLIISEKRFHQGKVSAQRIVALVITMVILPQWRWIIAYLYNLLLRFI